MLDVREFEVRDREGVLALAPRLTTGVAPWRDAAAVNAAVQGWVEAAVTQAGQEGHAVYVAVDDDVLVGMVSVGERRHFTSALDAYVGELVVSAEAERRGAGRALMGAAEQWARDRGLGCLTLETGAANLDARGFYEALGYVEEEVRLTKLL